MITEICCCGIVGFILIIIFLRLFGRAYIFYPRQQPPPAQSPYNASGNAYGTYSPVRPPPGTSQEVNMVRCQHCGTMYAEGSEGCPKCGGF